MTVYDLQPRELKSNVHTFLQLRTTPFLDSKVFHTLEIGSNLVESGQVLNNFLVLRSCDCHAVFLGICILCVNKYKKRLSSVNSAIFRQLSETRMVCCKC